MRIVNIFFLYISFYPEFGIGDPCRYYMKILIMILSLTFPIYRGLWALCWGNWRTWPDRFWSWGLHQAVLQWCPAEVVWLVCQWLWFPAFWLGHLPHFQGESRGKGEMSCVVKREWGREYERKDERALDSLCISPQMADWLSLWLL